MATYRSHPARAFLYGAVAGAFGSWLVIGGLITFPGGRLFEGLGVLGFALVQAGGMALASWLWRPRPPAFGLLLLPAVIVVIQPILGIPLGRTANIAIGMLLLLPVLHVGHLGGHLLLDGLLVLAVSLVAFGRWERGRVQKSLADAPRLRAAAVASDIGQPRWKSLESDRRRDLTAVLDTYGPLVANAAAQGARLVVLPEAVAWVNGEERAKWLDEVRGWASRYNLWLVAGFFDEVEERNLAVIIDPAGNIREEYEKQHPVPGDSTRKERMTQRVAIAATLGGLNAGETADYIEHQLRWAGATRPLFTREAVELITHYSRGLPRQINRLCTASLLAAAGVRQPLVEEPCFRSALKAVDPESA